MSVQIFIEGVKIDLHDNEGINIKLNTQDINDISKVNAGYTKGFSVPASKTNNKFFKHYYNADIIGGFDARTKKSAVIYLDDLEFISGKIRLTSTSLENNEIVDYRIQFEGDIVNIKDLLGDKKIRDLDLSEFDHDYTSENVGRGLQTSVFGNGSVIYPLISSVNRWVFDSSDAFVNTETTKNISYNSQDLEQSVNYNEFKPAVRISELFNKIQEDNGLNFVGDFFNRDYFKNLYLWFSNDAGEIVLKNTDTSNLIDLTNSTEPPFSSTEGGEWFDLANNTFSFANCKNYRQSGTLQIPPFTSATISLDVNIPSAFDDVKYNVVITADGEEVFRRNDATGTDSFAISVTEIYLFDKDIYRFYIECFESLSYDCEVKVIAVYGTFFPDNRLLFGGSATSDLNTIVGKVILSNQTPDLKQVELIVGIIKMFNIALTAQTDGSILWETLPEYYQNGKEFKDFEKYIDKSKTNIKRGKLLNELDFKYQEPTTVLGLQFKKNNTDAYGDLTQELKDPNTDELLDGGKLEIELPFENMVYERLRDLADNTPVNFQYGLSTDESLNPVVPKNLIFYNNSNFLTDSIGFTKDDGTTIATGGNFNTPNHCVSLSENGEQSLNWSSEISTYNFGLMSNSLYNSFYSDYVEDIFSPQRRLYTMDAIIPNFILANIKLNDRLIIQNKRYIINSINSNLTTGKTKLELINDIYNAGDLIGDKFFANPSQIFAVIEGGEYQSTIFNSGTTTISLVDEGSGIFASIQGANSFKGTTTKAFDVQENTGGQRTMSVLCDNGTETFKIFIFQEGVEQSATFDNTNITFDNTDLTFDNE